VPLKQFLQFLELFLALKNKIRKKSKTYLPDWVEPEARPNPQRAAAWGGRARPHKGGRRLLCASALAANPS
jgi:hypothetical protein